MYMTILFFAIEGCTIPNFAEFTYYYATSELGIDQLTWGLYIVMFTISITVGVMVYSKYMKDYEPRQMIKLSLVLNFASSVALLVFVKRGYEQIGLSAEQWMLLFMQPPVGLGIAIAILVPNALLAKITPSHVEATVFAFATSIMRASRQLGGSMMGVFVNDAFIGMTSKNLKDIDKAIIISCICRLLPLTYVFMIPTKD